MPNVVAVANSARKRWLALLQDQWYR